ncbi:hypothetical protein NLG97_g9673 [Lecanicillium saksenae]|uniref:Uncharacterized protein n=1 Tax=Lecanicillium saksenae TaxID=468837 RepID=A0ACC1QFC1_9HYPO|nr:hypothetical protein NLG97_g9673 [Lecanicillium saksenae]
MFLIDSSQWPGMMLGGDMLPAQSPSRTVSRLVKDECDRHWRRWMDLVWHQGAGAPWLTIGAVAYGEGCAMLAASGDAKSAGWYLFACLELALFPAGRLDEALQASGFWLLGGVGGLVMFAGSGYLRRYRKTGGTGKRLVIVGAAATCEGEQKGETEGLGRPWAPTKCQQSRLGPLNGAMSAATPP